MWKKKSIGLIFFFFPFPSFLFLFFLFSPLIFLLSYFPSTFLQSKEGLRGIRVPLVRSISKEKLVKITILLHGIRLLCITFNIFLPSTRSTYIYIYSFSKTSQTTNLHLGRQLMQDLSIVLHIIKLYPIVGGFLVFFL